MKKHLSFIGALLAAGLFAAPAYAADSNIYVSGDVGVSTFSNIKTSGDTGHTTTDAGINVMGAVGTKLDNWRVEAELGYQRNNGHEYVDGAGVATPANGSISVTSLLANGYYDFNAGAVDPYVTAGFGWASTGIHNRDGSADESHSALGYQFGVGVLVPVAKGIAVDARYRYFGTSNFSLNNGGGDLHVNSSNFLVGLKVGF